MNFQTMIQAGPVRANELFGKVTETSEAALKNRDKLFAELKAELEQHAQMEQDHLLPILQKHAETKDLAAEVLKDNRDLRAKLAELDGQPKNDPAFVGRIAALRKTFRQHARNDRKELLPVVQEALKAAAQGPNPGAGLSANPPAGNGSGKIEPSLAAAAQAKQDEAEQRRVQATAAREQAERKAEEQKAADQQAAAQRAEADRARQAEVQAQAAKAQSERQAEQLREAQERSRHQAEQVKAGQAKAEQAKAEQNGHATLAASQEKIRQQLDLAEREAAAERVRQAARRPAAEAVAAASNGIRHVAGTVAAGTVRLGGTVQDAGVTYAETVRRATPDLKAIGALPGLAASGMTELGSAWMGFFSQAAAANTRMTQDLAERQRQLAATTWRGWMEANAQAVRITLRVAQQGFDLTAAAVPKGVLPGSAPTPVARLGATQSGAR